MPNDLTADDLDRALAALEIPACPAIVMQVLTEAQKDMPDMRALSKTISADVGMSALAIKLANSPLFRVGAPVNNVSQALARLGTRNVVCVVVSVALRATMVGIAATQLEAFWNRASVVAIGAGLIARRQHGMSPDTAYIYALFHDAAIPAMMRRFKNYGEVQAEAVRRGRPLVELEADMLKCTHPIVGALMVRNWGLPALLSQAIRFHHEADVYTLPEGTLSSEALALIAVTHVAERLTHELLDEPDIGVGPLFDRAIKHLGISDGDLEDYREDLLSASSASGR
jgi:HD-like signal output (HDOD) protein